MSIGFYDWGLLLESKKFHELYDIVVLNGGVDIVIQLINEIINQTEDKDDDHSMDDITRFIRERNISYKYNCKKHMWLYWSF